MINIVIMFLEVTDSASR